MLFCKKIVFFFCVLTCASGLRAQFSQPPSSPLPAGTAPQAVAVGDFNKDGKPDLAVASHDSSSVSVLLGDGIGGFVPAPGSPIKLNNGPSWVGVGDFNGDGKLDLVAADTIGDLTVLLGDGSGGFSPLASIRTGIIGGGAPGIVADLNGDGKPDVALPDAVYGEGAGNRVALLMGDGHGGFAGTVLTIPGASRAVDVGDFNGDGKVDLVVAGGVFGEPGFVTILFGDGSGGFTVAPGSPLIPTDVGIPIVRVADFNLDGKADLVIGSEFYAMVLLGDGKGGFTPTPALPFGTASSPQAVAIADFNGDGRPDLAIIQLGFNAVYVLLGDGTGSFSSAPGSPYATGTYPYFAAAGDFNLDGRSDLAIPNYYSSNVTVLLNGLPFTSSESVTPSTGSGISQTFTFKYLGGNGLNDLAVVYALINANLSGAAGCFSYYVPATNSIYLLNDAGTEATGAPITPGGPGTLSNSQCSIDGPESSAIGVSNQLSLTLRVTFKQAVTGTQTLYGLSASSGNVNSGWKLLGTWTPQNIIDTPPTADSVTPSAGSGVIQSFAFKYSSANGFGYLNTVFALMNGSLKATAGCFAYYTRATNSIYLLDFSGTAVTGQPLTPGVAGTASNGKCTIDGAGSSVVGSGNTLTLTLAVTFTPGLRDLQTIYGFAVDGGNRNSGWTTLGTWTSQNVVNTPPTADSVTPNAGSGGTQRFIFKYSSANSYLYLNTLFVLFNRTLSGAGGCFFYYNPATVSVYLLNDQGTALAGPPLPLGSGTVSNGQCSIAGAGSSINQSGNSVALGLVITFKSSFTGMQTIYGYATDNGNHNSGWSNLGTWTTQPVSNTPPTVGSVSPQAGSGASQNFVFKYSSVNGSGYLSSAYALFNSSLTGVAGCLAFYVPGNNAVYLLNDAGSDLAGPGLTPGASGSVSNSQCTINGAGTSAVTSGNTLTLTLAVAFKPSFNGTQTTYGFASDAGGMNSGWQALGSWTSH